jgi:hypothetical protein
MVIFFVFLGVGILFFSPAYGGSGTMEQSPDAQKGVRASRDIPVAVEEAIGLEEALEEDTSQDDADGFELAADEPFLPVRVGEVNALAQEATAFRQKSGFDAFNAPYRNQWAATFNKKTGTVRLLYGAMSRPYRNGPEAVARGFLKDTYTLFGLKADLSDLRTERVFRTPERDHVRIQQTYNGVPIDGVLVLVHATPHGQVTMVQNGYRQGIQPANGQIIVLEAAAETARADLQVGLGTGAILSAPQVEPLIVPYQGEYYYIWKVTISTHNPIGYWVYHVDAESGAILYKADEIFSLKTGKGKAYKTNADFLKEKISNVPLKNMFTTVEIGDLWGHLSGVHAKIYDSYDWNNRKASQNIINYDYTFIFDPSTQKAQFDATHAYYQLQTVWEWWYKMSKTYGLTSTPDYFPWYPIPAIVNVGGLCSAFYTPNIGDTRFPQDPYDESMDRMPGFFFGDEGTCGSNPDFVLDNDVVRHEYTHAMMDWFGFDFQFGGDQHNYGRAMGEGNADFGAFLNTPKDPLIGEVVGLVRNLDNTRMYPTDVNCPACPDVPLNMPEEHYTGEIWGGYLYDLYRVLKTKAPWYIGSAYYYFDPSGGHRVDEPDFFDGIWAQAMAEFDLTGKSTNTKKAWGSMASRGINAWLRDPYSHESNYFGTGYGDSDNGAGLFWNFPPVKTISTEGNILKKWDKHEYLISTSKKGLLTATVTPKRNGALSPSINLRNDAGGPVASASSTASTKAVLTRKDLPAGDYIIEVTGDNSNDTKGYYNLTVTFKESNTPDVFLTGIWNGTYEVLNRYGTGDIYDCIFRETGDITLSIKQTGYTFNGNLQISNVSIEYVSGDFCVPPVPPVTYTGWVKGIVTDEMTVNGYRIDVSEASVGGFIFDPSSDGYYSSSDNTLVLKAVNLGTPNGTGWSDNYYLTITVQK